MGAWARWRSPPCAFHLCSMHRKLMQLSQDACSLQACKGGGGRKRRKLINSIHTVIIMTFILILDVMTAIFAACTAVILIRMETALWINFLFEKVYLIPFTVSV